jgi:ribosomal protein L24
MGNARSTSTRTAGLATAGLLALALAGVPTTASAATPGAVPDSDVTARSAKPGTQPTTVSNINQLRAAIERANKRDGRQRIRLGDDIEFDKGARSKGGVRFGDLDVSDDLVVNGGGKTIDARRVDRIFDVAKGAKLTLRNVALTGGAPKATESGGAITVQGTLKAKKVSLRKNKVKGDLASGGAIFNDGGKVTIVKSRLANNTSVRAGGAIEALEGTTVIRGSALARNSTGDEPGNGGALHLTGAGVVTITDTKVVRNEAGAEGGGLWNSAEGVFTIKDSVVKKNKAAGAEADQGGGGLYNDGGRLRVAGSTVAKNKATGELGSGGGILNVNGVLRVTGSTVSDNSSKRAGGGIETNAGDVTLNNVKLVGNSTGKAPGNGGGLHLTGDAAVTYDGGRTTRNKAAAEGGGLWNSETGRLIVTDVTIRKNKAPEKRNNYNDGGVFTVDGEPVASDNDDGGGLPFPLPF